MKEILDVKILKQCFFYTFLWGIVAHGYCFLNTLFSHDALNNLYIADKWNKAGLGRFFYPIYISLTRGRILLPWLVGLLGLFWTSLAVYLLIRMFQIRQTGWIATVSAICITNPTVYALAATYLHDFDADLFALFLSVFSAYLWKKAVEEGDGKYKWIFIGVSALVLSISLGIYQSYISVAITLIIFISIRNLLDNEDYVKVIKQGLIGILMLFLTAVFYMCEIFVFSKITGFSALGNNSYNGLGNMSAMFADGFIGKIVGAYWDFFSSFIKLNSAYPGRIYLLVHGILAATTIGVLCWALKNIKWQSKLLVLLLGLLMPLGMNVSYVLSGEMVHDVMRYAFWLVYLLAAILILWFNIKNNISKAVRLTINGLVACCMAIIIMGNIQTSNTIYLKKDLEYQATFSYMTRVADSMEEHAEYIPGETPVVFIGEGAIGRTMPGFEKFENITGVENQSPITFYNTYKAYFKYVLGRPISLMDTDEMECDERVLQMPAYPKEGSIEMIDEILVVKLK